MKNKTKLLLLASVFALITFVIPAYGIPPGYNYPYNGDVIGGVQLVSVNQQTGVATYSGSAAMRSSESLVRYVTEDTQYITMYLSINPSTGLMSGTGAGIVYHWLGSITTSITLQQTGWNGDARVYSGTWRLVSATGYYADAYPYHSYGPFNGEAFGNGYPPATIIFGHTFSGNLRFPNLPPPPPPPEQ